MTNFKSTNYVDLTAELKQLKVEFGAATAKLTYVEDQLRIKVHKLD